MFYEKIAIIFLNGNAECNLSVKNAKTERIVVAPTEIAWLVNLQLFGYKIENLSRGKT